MKWFKADNPPAISGEYLIWCDYIGRVRIADYSSMKKRWTIGHGFDADTIQPDQWTHLPEPKQR